MRPADLVAGVFTVLALAGAAAAHQPVMDMAPRWEGGFGAQVRYEYRFSDDFLDGDDRTSDALGREKRIHTTWLEGVYTFRREIRATLKIPFVNQERVAGVNGARRRHQGSGLGDVIFGVPLRKYWNLPGWTANVGLTPSLRAPTGSVSDDYPVGDGSWDFGLSTSLSAESALWYSLVDLFWWKNTPGRKRIDPGDEYGMDLNLGIHPFHDNAHNLGAFLMLDVRARHQERGQDDLGDPTGGTRLSLGPVLVGYWRNLMLRGEIAFPVYERVFGSQLSRGTEFNLGLGVAF